MADTDEWFPASIGQEVMAKLIRTGIDATFLELSSRLGHYATTQEPGNWTLAVVQFLNELEGG